jgi:hypothetical protein
MIIYDFNPLIIVVITHIKARLSSEWYYCLVRHSHTSRLHFELSSRAVSVSGHSIPAFRTLFLFSELHITQGFRSLSCVVVSNMQDMVVIFIRLHREVD